MTIHETLKEAADSLKKAGVPDSRLDAELLLAHVLNVSRMELALRGREALSPAAFKTFGDLLARRQGREPLQYILASQSFMGFDLYVDDNVLIPRPETELLCEQALSWLQNQHLISLKVLDLCTGSGALAVAISCLEKRAQVFAVDISEKALDVAKRNAEIHRAKVTFLKSDFLAAAANMQFDLIVCNPPYIPAAECETLQAEVRREPRIALDGGADGLRFYRKLALEAPACLCLGGALFCEVGYDQAEAVKSLFIPAFLQIEIFHDLNGIPRIVSAISQNSLSGGTHVRQV
jgi:release factor glutamine methyltransferase